MVHIRESFVIGINVFCFRLDIGIWSAVGIIRVRGFVVVVVRRRRHVGCECHDRDGRTGFWVGFLVGFKFDW